MGDYIRVVQKALQEEKYRRHEVPQIIKKLLEDNKWPIRKATNTSGKMETREFHYFPEFVEAPRPWGLQIEWDFIQQLCKGYVDVELELANAITGKHGGDKSKSMDHTLAKTTLKQKQLMQLEKHRPDLLEKISSGELTANSAMIEAGFQKPKIKAVKEPVNVAHMIQKHFSEAEIAEIIKILMGKE